MKTHHYGTALALASGLAFSTLAHADTLPPGAERFNLYTAHDALTPIDIPKGRTLVITDIKAPDGTEPKVRTFSWGLLHFQTGIEFRIQITTEMPDRPGVPCSLVLLSGYWLSATENH